MKIQLFVIILLLLCSTGLVYATSNYSTENHKPYYVAECVDFQNRINRYEGKGDFVSHRGEYGYITIHTKSHKITYPSHMCIIYSPKK